MRWKPTGLFLLAALLLAVGASLLMRPYRPCRRPVTSPSGRDPGRAAAAAAVRSPAGAVARGDGFRAAAEPAPVAAWERAIERTLAQQDVPVETHARSLKAAFDCLEQPDRLECLSFALNLLPDEQFPAIYPIMFDKSQEPDILDAIFDDALNRPEEIKHPLMKALRADREHPLFFDSARILDVVGDPDSAVR